MPETAARHAGITSRWSAALSHWLWAIPALLIVAALALRQIDAYPPAADEFYSMFNTGYLSGGPYSPLEIVESIQRQSSDHMPGFFMLLGSWGPATSFTLPIARVLPVLIGLLALALVYRLGKDLLAPEAGLIALVIMSSNAFFNFHYAFVRMYTLLTLFAAFLLWLYFRIMRNTKPRRRDYAALGASVASLILTHPLSATLLTALGTYHLLFARKDKRWIRVSLSVIAAVVVISPYLLVWAAAFGAVYERKTLGASEFLIDASAAIGAWLSALLNGQPALLVVSAVGVLLGIARRYTELRPWLILSLLHLGMLFAVAGIVPGISATNLRYHLVGWLPYVLLFAAALYCLYRFRALLLCLTLFWVIAGLWHQGEIDEPGWKNRLGWQQHIYPLPPWHAVSRQAQQAVPPPIVIAHVNMSFELRTTQHINYSQIYHYFDRHGVIFWQLDDLVWFDNLVNDLVISTPNLWVLYQPSKIEGAQQIAAIRDSMRVKNYEICESMRMSEDAVLLKYAWQTLDCKPPLLTASHQTRLIDHGFYGLELDGNSARFIDSWSAKDEFDQTQYNLSYQLLDQDWNNVAQVDLPLVHEGKHRQFSIGVSDVAPGMYHLVAIFYDKLTGETIEWIDNPGFVPGMIELSEIVIQEN